MLECRPHLFRAISVCKRDGTHPSTFPALERVKARSAFEFCICLKGVIPTHIRYLVLHCAPNQKKTKEVNAHRHAQSNKRNTGSAEHCKPSNPSPNNNPSRGCMLCPDKPKKVWKMPEEYFQRGQGNFSKRPMVDALNKELGGALRQLGFSRYKGLY